MKSYLLNGEPFSPHALLFSRLKKVLGVLLLSGLCSFSTYAQKTITGRVSSGDTALIGFTV
jgi:hypothetical protein